MFLRLFSLASLHRNSVFPCRFQFPKKKAESAALENGNRKVFRALPKDPDRPISRRILQGPKTVSKLRRGKLKFECCCGRGPRTTSFKLSDDSYDVLTFSSSLRARPRATPPNFAATNPRTPPRATPSPTSPPPGGTRSGPRRRPDAGTRCTKRRRCDTCCPRRSTEAC